MGITGSLWYTGLISSYLYRTDIIFCTGRSALLPVRSGVPLVYNNDLPEQINYASRYVLQTIPIISLLNQSQA